MKKVLTILGKIFLIAIISIIAIVILAWGGLNIAKFPIYSEYYSIESNVCQNPGLSDGFVCQGITVSEANERIFVSGYMKDNSASRIYITDYNSKSYYVQLTEENGDDFKGHVGGIATTDNTVYIADDNYIYTVELSSLLNANNGDRINIKKTVEVNNAASFVYSDENYLYVGEFHDGGKYVTEHPYQTDDGLFHAIVSRYDINDLSAPNKIYSISTKRAYKVIYR